MADPNQDQVFGTGGGGGGGSIFGGGSAGVDQVFGGGPKRTKPKKKGGGGFLHGAGRFLHGAGGQLEDIGYGLGPGLIDFAVQGAKVSPPALLYKAVTGQGTPGGLLKQTVVNPVTESLTVGTGQALSPIIHHPLREAEAGRIFVPALVAGSIVAPLVGRAAAFGLTTEESLTIPEGLSPAGRRAFVQAAKRKAALTGKIQGARPQITVNAGGGDVVTRTLPERGFSAGRQIVTDRLLKATTSPTTKVVGEYARAGRAIKWSTFKKTVLATLADPAVGNWMKSFGRLKAHERAAFFMHTQWPDPADVARVKETLAASADPVALQTKQIMNRPDVMKLYLQPSERIQKALNAWDQVNPVNQDLLVSRGALGPRQILEGLYGPTMIARGARLMTKSRAYNMLRETNGKITRLQAKKRATVFKAKTKAEVRSSIAETRRVSREANLSSAKREQLRTVIGESPGTGQVELGQQRVNEIRHQLDRAMQGELDSAGLNNLGISVPPELSSFHGLAGAFTEAQLKAERESLRASINRLPKETATPNWEESYVNKIARLQRQYDAKDPVRQKIWRQRIGDQISQEKANLKRLRGAASVRPNFETRLARVEKDLADLNSGALVSRPFDEHRMRVIGELSDMLGPALDDYERTLIGQHGGEVAAQQLVEEIDRALQLAEKQAKSKVAVARARENRIALLQAHREHLHHLISSQAELAQARAEIEAARGHLYLPGQNYVTIAEELASKGYDQPRFLPHQPAGMTAPGYSLPSASFSAVRPGGTVFQSGGELIRTGQFDMVGDVFTQRFMDNLKWAYGYDLHNAVMDVAVAVPKGSKLRPGFEWVREYRGQKMPFQESTAEGHRLAQADSFDLSGIDLPTGADLSEAERASDGVNWYMVPKQLGDQIRGDFRRSQSALHQTYTKAQTLWRKVLLHGSVPWLLHNIVGNMLLSAIHAAGPDGVKQLASMAARKNGKLSGEVFRSTFPEQTRVATFAEQQIPMMHSERAMNPLGQTVSQAKKLRQLGFRSVKQAFNALPAVDRFVETRLREFNVNVELRRSKEVREIYRNQPAGKKNMQAAMEQALRENPELQDVVSREINNALGDFVTMSGFEKDVVRAIFPFYGWFREITKITLMLPLNHPLKALMLARIGQIGNEISPRNVPSQLRGGYPLGAGYLLGTRAFNPFTSVIDVARGAGPFVNRPTAERLSNFFSLMGPLPGTLGETALYPSTAGRPVPPLIGLPYTIGRGMPQARAFFPYKSQLYPNRTREQAILRYLFGDPRIHYDPGVAADQSQQGR